MKNKFKRIGWIAAAIALIAAIIIYTEPTEIYQANPILLTLSATAFIGSLMFWALAWNYLIEQPAKKSLKINTKSLMGLFAPAGLGADLLRAYFSKKEGKSGSKAIAASFMVKFWKFLLMFFLLLTAIILLAPRSPDFQQNTIFFIAGLILTMTGAIIVLLFRFKKIVNLIDKISKKLYADKFHEKLRTEFHTLQPRTTAIVVGFLIISTALEVLTAGLLFLSLGVNLTLIQIFIFTAVAHSLMLIAITPQGIGIAEGGGYIVLSMQYYSLSTGIIGSVLILWNIIRIWIPSAVGLLTTTFYESRINPQKTKETEENT